LTINFWIKHTTHPKYEADVVLGNLGTSGGCAYQCFISNAQNKMVFEYRFSTSSSVGHNLVSNTEVPENVWTLYTVTYAWSGTSALVSMYVNGELDAQAPFLDPINYSNPGSFRIGSNIDLGLQRFFLGDIDDIMIHDRVLSAGEINQIYTDFGVTVEERSPQLPLAFPNPAMEQIVLTDCAGLIGEMLEIWSAEGRMVFSQRVVQDRVVFDVRSLVAGAYMIRSTTSRNLLARFMKQ
jgi:hypothetical protein